MQQAVFRAQVRLARELDRPVVIHTREADEDTLAILREEGGGEVRGVLHCFTGNDALADAGLALGFFVSLAGIVTFPKAGPLRQTARRVPLDRLLAETDSPFLAPVPYRGKRNEPAYVARVVAALAEMHQIPPGDLADAHDRQLPQPCSGRDKVLNENHRGKVVARPVADLRADPRRPREGRRGVRAPRAVEGRR